MTEEELLALLESCGALRHGHFRLSSGLHARQYVQCALLLEEPARARRVGEALAQKIATESPQSILAPALGGLIIGHEVAAALDLPFRFTERSNGDMCLRRGFSLRSGERVAVIEDVVTTGRSTLETIAAVEREGAEAVAVGSIIDRTPGASPFALPFRSLLRLELESYLPSDCPLCAEGLAIQKPGSRPSRGTPGRSS